MTAVQVDLAAVVAAVVDPLKLVDLEIKVHSVQQKELMVVIPLVVEIKGVVVAAARQIQDLMELTLLVVLVGMDPHLLLLAHQ